MFLGPTDHSNLVNIPAILKNKIILGWEENSSKLWLVYHQKNVFISIPASYEGGAPTSNGSRDRSPESLPICPDLCPEMRLLFERSWSTTSAQATKQMQQSPMTITPTSTDSSLLLDESIEIKINKHDL